MVLEGVTELRVTRLHTAEHAESDCPLLLVYKAVLYIHCAWPLSKLPGQIFGLQYLG